jgi:hypothetical protein
MYGTSPAPIPARQGKSAYRKIKKLIRELDDTDDEEVDITLMTEAGTSRSSSSASISTAPPLASVDPNKPWLKEFNHYLNTVDEIPDGLTVVKWWGVSANSFYSSDISFLIYACSSSMLIAFRSGHHLRGITYPLWHHRCQASEHSRQRGLLSVSAGTASKLILWKHFSF